MAKILQIAYGDARVRVSADDKCYQLAFLSGGTTLKYAAGTRQHMANLVDSLRDTLSDIYYELTSYSGPFTGILDDVEGEKDDGQHEDL